VSAPERKPGFVEVGLLLGRALTQLGCAITGLFFVGAVLGLVVLVLVSVS
jgi:hypothetical protein